MLSLSSTARIYICRQPVDMRKSFDGQAAAKQLLAQNPASGHFFVFANGRRTLIKILNWSMLFFPSGNLSIGFFLI
jgi:transposase